MKREALGSVSALACDFWRPRRKWAGASLGLRFRVEQRLSSFHTVLGEGAEDHTRWRVCSPFARHRHLLFPQILMRGSIELRMDANGR